MLSPRQSFLLSLGGHIGIVVVLLVAGLLLAQKIMGPRPVEVDLISTVAPGPDNDQGAPDAPDVAPDTEPEPTIVEREVPKDPEFNPNQLTDMDKMPDIKKQDFTPIKPPVIGDGGGPPASAEDRYKALIRAACYSNWSPPGLGVLGRPVPETYVEITVARTGQILSHRITRESGNPRLDRTVEEAIRLSNPLPAFPPELTGTQKTFTIRFTPQD